MQRVLLISRGFLRNENADKDQPTRRFLHCILTTKTSTDGIPRETISSPTILTIQKNKNLTLIQCLKLKPKLKVNQELAQAP